MTDSSCSVDPSGEMSPALPAALCLRAVRGATQLDADAPELYAREMTRLMQALLEANDIGEDDILTVFFTVTPDLCSDNPARIVREAFDWRQAPLLCGVEPAVENLPPRCVRVLIQFYSARAQRECRPVYLNGAAALRPDIVEASAPAETR
ncbi:MAG: chorismate mutase [Vampirovibrionales bacterium]|nr:chorismate mutase [Vampirovibrionales bacterium]